MSESVSVGQETGFVLPPGVLSKQVSDNPAPSSAYHVEVSGGIHEVTASNVASTMFAEKHTQSILSNETNEPHMNAP